MNLWRLGLLLMVGAVFASLIQWYTAFGQMLGNLEEDVSTEREDMLRHFVDNFLLAGTIPGLLFYGGAALAVLGVVLRTMAPAKGKQTE